MNFQDMIIRFDLGENTSLPGWECFKEDIILTESILPKSPIILSTSLEKGVFEGLFQFQAKFAHSWSTSVDQSFHMTREPRTHRTKP